MSAWSRLTNLFRSGRIQREIDEELASHIAEAVASGRDPDDARRAFGSMLRHRETSLDIRLMGWLDSLGADARFAWRQLGKSRVTTAAAVVSLALAIGACTAAFRLIDALLFRPLPVAEPGRLYAISFEGVGRDDKPLVYDSCSYPLFQQLRAAAAGRAELLATSLAERTDLTYGSEREMEQAYRQLVSGWLFQALALRPALGRLLTEQDDRVPGAHPYAVLSHDYWMRRFGGDRQVIGRTFHMGASIFEVVGVLERGFTGTEPGTFVDIFVPAMMEPDVQRSNSSWLRTLVRLEPGVSAESLRDPLHASFHAFQVERAKAFRNLPARFVERFVSQRLRLDPAASGVSYMQRAYGRALAVLATLVALVLLMACANVANLMTARATSRTRELALRVSIGAGRARLVQLMLVESAWLAGLAAGAGSLFAWWAAPIVLGLINPPDDPARLALPADWRVVGFGVALAFVVTFLFGLGPALKASSVTPAGALRKDGDAPLRRRVMHALVAVQTAFCVVVTLLGGLFVTTYERLANQPTGFSAERLLALTVVSTSPQLPVLWQQVADALGEAPGVERVALADRPLLDGQATNSFISVNGEAPGDVLAYFRAVSPSWLETMKIPLHAGRNLLLSDPATVALVSETFVKTYFAGSDPVGRTFVRNAGGEQIEIVGVVKDARYRNMREPMLPVVYVPFASRAPDGAWQPRGQATLLVQTTALDPLVLATDLRRRVADAHSGFRVSDVRTQLQINRSHTVRERLLALMAAFFAGVALVLAGVGLFGVLHYAVLQRRREIAIRMALGAQGSAVVRHVTATMLRTTAAGALAGVALSLGAQRHVEALVYDVRVTDAAVLWATVAGVGAVALLASGLPVIQALRVDPCRTLRAE